jgi:adenosylmethionine-8-amino-7-oxononanoate aminotransferase
LSTIADLDRRHLWHPFTQAYTAGPPVVAVGGQGARLFTEDGREFLDMVSSWWVNLHGHGHPEIAEAIAIQARRLEQVIFADFTHPPAAELAAKVCGLLPGDLSRVFYSDDGSTAVEVALKLSLQYWANLGQSQRKRFIAFDGGYHGDTVGAMSAGASSGYFRAFAPLLFPVDAAPFPATWDGDTEVEAREAEALAAVARLLDGDEVAAVIIEPLIQGAGGMRICRPQFLQALAGLVRDAGALLVFDEVMTGFGRTGALFACLGAGVTPDLICLSKGLTGGFLPMAMTVAREEIYRGFLSESLETAFLHGHSYTANPLGCAAGLASLELLLQPACAERRAAISLLHREELARLAADAPITRGRVLGTIAAFDLPADQPGYGAAIGGRIKRFCLERGVLVRPLGNVVYLLPPYCTTPEELQQAWKVVGQAVAAEAEA